ncbi:colicin E3/pyocin S6 family cytotoxin [Azospirillum rugosum]|uniref:colicin E3/pyocin S6 family cytotoxin n=1 Tax=Azospirillum rugosum TaxID=416170 RepID=UPI0035204AF5
MARHVPPKPSILDGFDFHKVIDGRKVWKNQDGTRYYSWDALHGEVEMFDRRGYHLGSLHPEDGRPLKDPVRGRRLNVH